MTIKLLRTCAAVHRLRVRHERFLDEARQAFALDIRRFRRCPLQKRQPRSHALRKRYRVCGINRSRFRTPRAALAVVEMDADEKRTPAARLRSRPVPRGKDSCRLRASARVAKPALRSSVPARWATSRVSSFSITARSSRRNPARRGPDRARPAQIDAGCAGAARSPRAATWGQPEAARRTRPP